MSSCSNSKCAQLGVCNCPALEFQDPDEHSPARDVVPDYMSCWEWVGFVLQAGAAAAAAVAIVCGGLGFAIGKWVP